MPELPDLEVYAAALAERTRDARLEAVTVRGPFLVRTVEPPLSEAHGARVLGVRRFEKRLAFELETPSRPLFLVLHLMIAGRLHWHEQPVLPSRRIDQAVLSFSTGHLLLTEAGTKRRAALHLVAGAEGLAGLARGGLEVLEADRDAFAARLAASRHTLKRSLCDPRIFSGIGNAYSDEILHRAGLSPLQLPRNLDPDEVTRLFDATREVLEHWTGHLRSLAGDGFPRKVTAFRPGMAVHGRHREPCPACGAPVQRIVRAENEFNYCPGCQTGGRILRDRALSRLLKESWPETLEDL
jgi:formamidopyrimidine-DNA glycosylase